MSRIDWKQLLTLPDRIIDSFRQVFRMDCIITPGLALLS